MIEPTDFHKTAEFLKDKKDEWHVRTSVNRSYYGAFLYFREFLSKRGVDIPKPTKKSQHKFIIECFEKSKTEAEPSNKIQIGQIWNKLKTLFDNRIKADYRLDLRFPPNYSEDSLRCAKTTIEDFNKLNGSATEKLIIEVATRYGQEIKMKAIED
jgi:hypothetical protein